MNESSNTIIESIEDYITEKQHEERDFDDISDDLHNHIVDAVFKINDIITVNSLMLTEDVIKKLDVFCELVNQEDYLEKYGTEKIKESYEQEIEDGFNEVIDEMRKDLDIDKLNTGLRRRVGGIKASRRKSEDTEE